MLKDYNRDYEGEDFYRGLEPHDLVKESMQYVYEKHSKVLDLGCGEGKDSFFLAKKGFDVTAVDISEVGINKVEKYCEENDISIKTQVSDALSYLKEDGYFDAIYAINVLQFMNKNEVYEVVKEMQNNTMKNGLIVVAGFIAENQSQKERMASRGGYYFDENELKGLYKDFKIIKYEEVLGDRETHGQPRHRHYMVRMIAQKI